MLNVFCYSGFIPKIMAWNKANNLYFNKIKWHANSSPSDRPIEKNIIQICVSNNCFEDYYI